jgi:ABC-2 type transport system permease protein
MPGWLRGAAEWNPMSTVVVAARRLFGTDNATVTTTVWPQLHPILATVALTAAVLAVCAPIAVRLYTKRVR